MEQNSKNSHRKTDVEQKQEKQIAGTGLFKRIVSILLIGIMLFLFGWLIFAMITGSPYVIPILFIVIIFPLFIYLFIWIKKVFTNNR